MYDILKPCCTTIDYKVSGNAGLRILTLCWATYVDLGYMPRFSICVALRCMSGRVLSVSFGLYVASHFRAFSKPWAVFAPHLDPRAPSSHLTPHMAPSEPPFDTVSQKVLRMSQVSGLFMSPLGFLAQLVAILAIG